MAQPRVRWLRVSCRTAGRSRTTWAGQRQAFDQDRRRLQYGILYRNWDLGTRDNTISLTRPARRPPAWAPPARTTPSPIINNLRQQLPERFPVLLGVVRQSAHRRGWHRLRHYIMKDTNLFFNDDWRITKRLTSELGLRWERYWRADRGERYSSRSSRT